jgi:hypothetical protein
MLNLRVDSILATSPTLCPIPERGLYMKLIALPISIFLLTIPLLSNVWISARMNTRKINLARIMKLAASSRASAMVWCHTLTLSCMLLRIICSYWLNPGMRGIAGFERELGTLSIYCTVLNAYVLDSYSFLTYIGTHLSGLV